MRIVRTVTGDVDARKLGITSAHEHVLIEAATHFQDAAETPTIDPVDPDVPVVLSELGRLNRNPKAFRANLALDDAALAATELTHFRNAGGGCVVDLTNIGLGRDARRLRDISKASGVLIVAGCGFYVEAAHPAYVASATEAELAAAMVTDIVVGIDGSSVRAGVIGEIGTSALGPSEQKVLRASARASFKTGAAISVHIPMGRPNGERILDILLAAGARPKRIILGHMDETLVRLTPAPTLAYLDYHRRVLDRGAWIAYDTFGSEWYYDNSGLCEPRDTERVAGLATLIAEGYERQLLIGQDVWTKQCLKRYGGWGYDHLLRVVPVLLRRAGVSDAQIRTLLIDNPRRAFALAQPRPGPS